MRNRINRAVSALLSVVMLLSLFAFPASAARDVTEKRGDVDGDGFVLPRDAAIVARYLAGWEDYVDENGDLTCPDPEPAGFCIGYGKVNMTPDLNDYRNTPLAGYGTTDSRMATGVPDGDGLFLTCVAVRDERGEIILLFTMDIIRLSGTRAGDNESSMIADGVKEFAARATGIPVENMTVNASHTHSGPDFAYSYNDSPRSWGYMSRYFFDVFQKGAQAARRAVADLTPATMWAGDTSVKDINFVRRFLAWYSDSDTYKDYETHTLIGETDQTHNRVSYEGPNNVDDGAITYEHETSADNEVQYIVFKREGVKDVLLYNWQCHADITGNDCYDLNVDGSYHAFDYNESNYKNISKTITPPANRIITADYVTGVRRVLEGQEGYLTAFFNGGSGNINYYDNAGYAGNARFGVSIYNDYRLPGWDDRYYDFASSFTTSTGRKGYWRSQMIGAIVADAIKRDIVATDNPYVYKTPYRRDVESTQADKGRTYIDANGETRNVISHNWTNNIAGLAQLPTGNVNVIHYTYRTTRENNDRDLQTVMAYLADLASAGKVSTARNGSDILLKSTYSVTYSGTTLTVTKTETDAIRALAAEYATKTTAAEKKTFANEVLMQYTEAVTEAFRTGMYDGGGSGGANNAAYKKARLLCRLATGLYVSNYSANRIRVQRNSTTDLTCEITPANVYTVDVPISCFSIGRSVAFTMLPYEMFDTVGQMIKDGRYIRYDEQGDPVTESRTATKPTGRPASYTVNGVTAYYPDLPYEAATYEYTDEKSPFIMTFTCGYSDAYMGYVPTHYAMNHPESPNNQNGYECYVTWFKDGTAEAHAAAVLEMLDILYSDGDTTPRLVGVS